MFLLTCSEFTQLRPAPPFSVDHTLSFLALCLLPLPRLFSPTAGHFTMAQTPRKLKPTGRKSTGTVAKKIGAQPLGGAKGRKSVGGGGKGKGGKSRRE